MAFTDNEAIAAMHENTSNAFALVADYIEKWKLDYEETVKLLREISDEHDAQKMVVKLRDLL